MNFVNRLKAWRDRQGLSQGEAAKLLDVSRSYLNQVENGREPGRNLVAKLDELEEKSKQDQPILLGVNPREKLTSALNIHHMKPADLARKIGYDAGVIANVVRGAGRASEEMIERIVREIPELTKEDLMEGSEHPYILTDDDMNGTYGAKSNVVLPSGMKGRQVPVFSNARAGAWDAGYTDEHWDGETVFALNVDDRRAFAIRVVGNSMEPEINEGDIVICSPKTEVAQGDCAVVRTKSEQAFIKFWKQRGDNVILESANPDYEPLKFPAGEIAGVWPVVQRIACGRIKKTK